mgnify:FL=1
MPSLEELNQLALMGVSDGIIDQKQYVCAPYKILWILKETNGQDLELAWALGYQAKQKNWGGFYKTYRRVVQISSAILEKNWDSMSDAKLKFPIIIPQIAVVNINKMGGTSKSKHTEILDYYKQNKQLLMRQIKAINPDIIINANQVNEMFDEGELFGEVTDRKYKKACKDVPFCNKKGIFMIGRFPSTGQLILNVYHPQSTKLNDVEYFLLVKQCFKEYRLA